MIMVGGDCGCFAKHMQRVGDHWEVSSNSVPAFMEASDTLYIMNRLHKDIAFHVYYAFEWIHPL